MFRPGHSESTFLTGQSVCLVDTPLVTDDPLCLNRPAEEYMIESCRGPGPESADAGDNNPTAHVSW